MVSAMCLATSTRALERSSFGLKLERQGDTLRPLLIIRVTAYGEQTP